MREVRAEGLFRGPWIAWVLAMSVACYALSGQAESSRDESLEARVSTLLQSMTLEQKIGQMIQAEIQFVTPDEAKRYYLGSILNGGGSFPSKRREASVDQWLDLAQAYYDASVSTDAKVPIPMIWGTDAVHGHNNVRGATLFPHNIGLGATRDADLIERIGRATALEVLATGIDWTFAPTLAVAKDARWGRTYESYSDDPERVAELGRAMVRGLQGKPDAEGRLVAGRVAATAKHFIGDGATRDGIDQGDVVLEEDQLIREHGAGYLSTLDEGVLTVMASFNSVQGRKVHGDKKLMTDLLKTQWRFDGLVVSDWNGIGQVAGCTNSDCAQAINAGIDLVMAPEDWKDVHLTLLRQVRSGVIPMSRIDDAVSRILRTKLRLGLFDHAGPRKRAQKLGTDVVGSSAHRELAREAVRKSLVMLKNDQAVLPLAANQKLLVFGDAAREISSQAGGWSVTWQGTETRNEDFPGATSIFEGLQRSVESAGGQVSFVTAEDAEAAEGDVALVVFGERPYAEGEGDLAQLGLRGDQTHLQIMRTLRARGIPVVAILLTGRPLWLNPELNAANALVVAWLPGSEGEGVADVLIGDAEGNARYPVTGRLPFPWPASSVAAEDGKFPVLYPRDFGLSFGESTGPAERLPESLVTQAQAQDFPIFDRRTISPWRMFVGDRENWQQAIVGSDQVSAANAIAITTTDRRVQGDSRRLNWTGRSDAQWYLQATRAMDLTEWHQRDAVLEMELAVHEPPTRAVELRVDCQYPCGAKADVTRLLRAAPKDEWVRLSLDLECFRSSGLALNRVDTLPLIRTAGRLSLSVAKVRLVANQGSNATIACRRQ
jgi:beta-glucosidase